MADSGTYTPDTIARKMAMAQQLLGDPKKPVTHWAEGLNELAKGYFGGKMYGDAETAQKEGDTRSREFIASLLGGGTPPTATGPQAAAPQAPPPGGPMGDLPGMANSIASIESGGKYDALGPMTKGDRAYGKYQVMGANVPQWTKQHLGQEMTPEQFLQNPQAQDAVFKGQFGQYAQKYGPEGAARAWFAGEGGMNNPNAKDVLGTTVQGYADKFNKGMGNQVVAALGGGAPSGQPASAPPQQMAQAGPPQTAGNPMQARIVEALRSKDPYIAKAAQGLAGNLLSKQFEGDKPTDEMREYNLYKQQGGNKSFFDYKADLKKAGSTNVTTNVGGGSDKQIFDTMDTRANEARTLASGLTGLREAKQALQQGIISGAAANEQLGLQKLGAALGLSNSDKIVNTETFRAAIAPQVAAMIKSTVGTTNISNTDREFAEKAAGGNITLDGKSIERLVGIMEKAAVGKLTAHQKTLERVYPDAEKYARERALFGVEMPAELPPIVAAPPSGNVPLDDLLKLYGPK